MDDYLSVNRANWDDRVPLHVGSPDYGVQRYLDDPAALSGVVEFDRPRLGDLHGIRGIHLQCHICTDTISLARLGATMTGLDFSAAALIEARSLAERSGARIEFVESDVYSALDVAPPHSFGLVCTGIGALCWLPRIDQWTEVVDGLLGPGGRLFVRDIHPMAFALNDSGPGPLVVDLPYFETADPIVTSADVSYVTSEATLSATTTHEWNHGLGEIVTALLDRGLAITCLTEHDSLPFEAFPGRMILGTDGEWRFTEHRERVPLSFTLQATRR